MVRFITWLLGLGLVACDFSVPPVPQTLGAPCATDSECASRVCAGQCVACREDTQCGSGQKCDQGRCAAVEAPLTLPGIRSTNREGRVHVGRVGVVPVVTVEGLQ